MNLSKNRSHKRPACGFAKAVSWQLAATILLCLSSWLVADDPNAESREANRRRVADMSAAERDRLHESYQSFQALPPDQQARLRDLQAAVERDAELRKAFESYQAWANSLSPWQRHELRQTKDPDARLRLIEQFKHRGGSPNSWPQGEGFDRFRRPEHLPVIAKVLGPLSSFASIPSSTQEAHAMIEVLEPQLPTARREELRNADPFTRRVRVFRDTLQRTRGLGPMQRLTGNTDDGLSGQLLAALSDGSPARQFVESRREGPEQRMALLAVLSRGLVTDLLVTIQDRFPSQEALRQFERGISKAERESLNKVPEPDRHVQLQLKYLEDLVPGIREWREMSQDVQSIQAEYWRSRMQGGDRGSRPGNGPPFDGSRRRSEDERFKDKDRRSEEREPKSAKPET